MGSLIDDTEPRLAGSEFDDIPRRKVGFRGLVDDVAIAASVR